MALGLLGSAPGPGEQVDTTLSAQSHRMRAPSVPEVAPAAGPEVRVAASGSARGTVRDWRRAAERARAAAAAPTAGTPVPGSPVPTSPAPGKPTSGPAPTGTAPTGTAPTPDAPPVVTPPVRDPNAATADIRAYGAKCDGVANDRDALQAAITDMSAKHGVVTVSGNCRILTTDATPGITLATAVTIRGTTPGATLGLDADKITSFRQMFGVTGDDVTLQDLTLARRTGVYGVMINLYGSRGFTMDGVVIDGRRDVFSGQTFHGIAIWGALGNAKMLGSTIRNTDYGLFQDSGVRTTTDGFTVDRSTFTGNVLDDLEFNAPNGRMVDITVTGSTFSANRADRIGAGFGVGLANVQNARIQGNTFDGYAYEPVHIEDRSAFVTVADNIFRNSFTAGLDWASHVWVADASHDITVTGNTFDTSGNGNRIDCVWVGPGGNHPTVTNVTITGNTFRLRPTARTVGNYGATGVTESGNTVVTLA
ncbi:hypothetical protein GCM10009836_46410 [Pseudonocardia ailaonensis]|uniref:Right handed beta helix domain-containing protein n=1 Tax=Pseudonocardia ailaonensis TaxID=367279 RepID=A0ABN2NC57_9PSEU